MPETGIPRAGPPGAETAFRGTDGKGKKADKGADRRGMRQPRKLCPWLCQEFFTLRLGAQYRQAVPRHRHGDARTDTRSGAGHVSSRVYDNPHFQVKNGYKKKLVRK